MLLLVRIEGPDALIIDGRRARARVALLVVVKAGAALKAGALLVFVEVVATDGPVSEARQAALMRMAADAGFREEQVAFVTAYDDRDAGAFRRSVDKLAWRSFAWFMSEPNHVMGLHRGSGTRQVRLSELMRVAVDVD